MLKIHTVFQMIFLRLCRCYRNSIQNIYNDDWMKIWFSLNLCNYNTFPWYCIHPLETTKNIWQKKNHKSFFWQVIALMTVFITVVFNSLKMHEFLKKKYNQIFTNVFAPVLDWLTKFCTLIDPWIAQLLVIKPNLFFVHR